MAEASLFVLDLPKSNYAAATHTMLSHISLGSGEDITILELAWAVPGVTEFRDRLSTDLSKSGGTRYAN